MAAKNTRVSCPVGVWTQITDSVTTDISVALLSNVPVSLQATSSSTAPTDDAGPLELLRQGDGWSEATILEKFPGVATASYLWAKPLGNAPSAVGTSHA